MNNYRRVALRLHTLHDADQKWLLNHLPDQYRGELVRLIDELTTLPITVDKDLAHLAITKPMNGRDTIQIKEKKSIGRSVYINIINSADADLVHDRLRTEEAWIIAVIMDAYHWRWKEDVSRRHNSDVRYQLKHCRNYYLPNIKPQVVDSILESFAYMIEHYDDLEDDVNTSNYAGIFAEIKRYKIENLKPVGWWARLWQR